MRFVSGAQLAREIQSLIVNNDQIEIACAFIGTGFDELIAQRPSNASPVIVRCNLHLGGTNPRPLVALLKRKRPPIQLLSCPTLHAKVILSGRRAIVSSANLSHRALGTLGDAEVPIDPHLDEAGIVVTNRAELTKIRNWLRQLGGAPINTPNHRILEAAQSQFDARQLTEPLRVAEDPEVHNEDYVRRVLCDPANAEQIANTIVLIPSGKDTQQAKDRMRQVQKAGHPVKLNHYYEGFDRIPPGATIIGFTGSTKTTRVTFAGFYRMRTDKWAVQSNPRSKERYWLQLIEPLRIAWLPASDSCKAALRNLVQAHRARVEDEDDRYQFPLADLVKRLDSR